MDEEEAYYQGWHAGYNNQDNEDLDNPYAGTEAAAEWDQGYRDGAYER